MKQNSNNDVKNKNKNNLTIDDDSFEKLLKVLGSFVMTELEDDINFDDKNDKQREDIIKASLKALEVSTFVTSKFFDITSFDHKKLENVANALDNKKFEEANLLLNTK